MAPHNEDLIDIRSLTKRYPGVTALDAVDFTVRKGETHVLVGENGAGKTTPAKVLCGAEISDSYDQFLFDGHEAEIRSPKDALSLGVAAIQQTFSVIEHLTADRHRERKEVM